MNSSHLNPDTNSFDAHFVSRKEDHLKLSLLAENEAMGSSGLDQIQLIHDSLPDLDFDKIEIGNPFYIAGMTAGHENATELNFRLAGLAANRGWKMGVGSQRRELAQDAYADASVFELSKKFPNLKLIANFGIAQLIEVAEENKIFKINEIAERMEASWIAIHLNPLQEAIQAEGTPFFKGSFQALEKLIQQATLPVVIKETGSGMSTITLQKLNSLSPAAVDVSGFGGTHWGRIEGKRGASGSVQSTLGETFKNWGVSTVESVRSAKKILARSEVWASGGVRSGLDAAKLIALGANQVGFAKPALQSALQGEHALHLWAETLEKELKVALFCTNSATLNELNSSKISESR